MREILFKAKRVDNGEWVEGNLIISHRNHVDKNFKCVEYYILNDDYLNGEFIGFKIKVIPKTVSQFTGLTDKNGVKIFENDIVKFTNDIDELFYEEIGMCEFETEESGYVLHRTIRNLENYSVSKTISTIYLIDSNKHDCSYEVLGNIFDNLELLEGKNE